MNRQILLATRSAHKAAEIQRILKPTGIALLTLDDAGIVESVVEDELEDAPTFIGNAVAKAGYFARLSNLPTIADDSGLEVAALQNRPGVRTRRFALDHGRTGIRGADLDQANNDLLLELLGDAPVEQRRARYVCCAAFAHKDSAVAALGTTAGSIGFAARGTNGFGYDPIFALDGLDRTFAELTPDQKDDRSHRARAFRALASILS